MQRFKSAQQDVYQKALGEIQRGTKTTHWIWFVFPQMRGLGMSETSLFYGIKDLDEAVAYLEDPELSHNLLEISKALLEHENAAVVLGAVDAIKVKSSATLFEEAAKQAGVSGQTFTDILEKFFAGERDQQTLRLIKKA